MDAQRFLTEFGHIANAPGGVARLRELVLSLAVSGRLLEPGAHERGSTDELLASLEQELAVYKATRRSRRKSGDDLVAQRFIDHPTGWLGVRLGQIGVLIRGVSYDKSVSRSDSADGLVGLLRANNIGSHVTFDDLVFVPSALVDQEQFLQAGDILLAMSSGSRDLVGKAALVIEERGCAFGAFCGVYRSMPSVRSDFIQLVMQSPAYRKYVSDQGKGIGINNLTKGHIERYEFLLPDHEEQSRIVARVEELMAMCDQLEKLQQDRRKLQNALRQSTLQALADAQSPHELKVGWQRLQFSFRRLFGEPEDVDDVIAKLENMAVRGLMVGAGESSADLERIKADCSALRSQYISAGLMRRQKLVGMADSEATYPEHWGIAAFDELAVVIGGVTKGRDLGGRQVVVCPYLAVANVQRGYFKLEGLKSIEIAADELPKYLVHEGDLLITEGGDWDKVGRTAIWQGGVENCLHQNHIFKARIPSEFLLKPWVELVFNSGVGRDYFAGASKQTTNLASINMTQLRSFPMPVPLLEEQQRILDALAALTDLCGEWRQQLKRERALAALLARAAVADLTGITIEQDKDTAVKAPQTELIAPLRLGTAPDVKAQAPLATILSRHKGEMASRDLWQRFGGDIDAFYAQLKVEVMHGWIAEPSVAEVREKPTAETAKA